MNTTTGRSAGMSPAAWAVVAAVGLLILVIVFALGLFGRLSSGQDVLDGDAPAFERVQGARAGINIVSTVVDTADPIATANGGAAAEVPKLAALVSTQTGLSLSEVIAALQQQAPKTTALLQSIPLSDVSQELPGLLKFLSSTLKLSPEELNKALQQNFPGISQTIENLPKVTSGWENVPGTANFTNFAGEPVKTVPDVRDYFSGDVVPVLETQQGNFTDLKSKGGVGFIPLLLTVLGAIVLIFGLVMMRSAGAGKLSAGRARFGWVIVTVVGLVVIVLVFGLKLFPRLDGGNDLLKGAEPAYAQDRVDGSQAGINIVSEIVDTADPITTDSGSAASEVPKLLAFVSDQTGLSQPAVLAALKANAPKTTTLLQSIPLSDVTKELPGLLKFLGTTLKLSPEELNAALQKDFPALSQTIASLPKMTSGWDDVPGTANFTNFAGDPIKTVPEVRDYFADDVIPDVLTNNQSNFDDLNDPWPPVSVFPPLLLVVGIIVLLYGILMFARTRRT